MAEGGKMMKAFHKMSGKKGGRKDSPNTSFDSDSGKKQGTCDIAVDPLGGLLKRNLATPTQEKRLTRNTSHVKDRHNTSYDSDSGKSARKQVCVSDNSPISGLLKRNLANPVQDKQVVVKRKDNSPNTSFESDSEKSSKKQVCISDDSPLSGLFKRNLATPTHDKNVIIHAGNGRLLHLEGDTYRSSEDLNTATPEPPQPPVNHYPTVDSRTVVPCDDTDRVNTTRTPGDSCLRYYSPSSPKNTDSSRRRSFYLETQTSHDLTGRATLSPKDLIFGIPSPPERPPRVPNKQHALRKSKSTPNINKASVGALPRAERKPRSKTGIQYDPSLWKRGSISCNAGDGDDQYDDGDSGAETDNSEESDDSCMAWSDDDASMGSAASMCSSPDKDEVYENMNFKTFDNERAHQIAQEFLATELSYVKKLEILNKARDQTEEILGNEVAKEMFPYINSIYSLHKDSLLAHFTERLNKWESHRQIGDIMKTFAPYLKLYTDYVKNFDNALKMVDLWNSKSPEFSKMLKSLPSNGPSLNLKVQIKSHMLEPVQRVPRYKLLLQQYSKEIPEESSERADLQVALSSVSQAAIHFEEMMKHGSSMMELMELQRHIDCPVNLVSTGRQLVKQGKIGKVNATTGKVVSRYLFLFNDLFLVCSEQAIYIPGLQPKYKCRQMLEIDGMQITDGDNLEVPNTFYVKTRKKAIELSASSEEEMNDWEQELWKVIGEKMRSKLSKSGNGINRRRTMMLRAEGPLGKEAPVWVHNRQVTMCMTCGQDFKGFRKKHHCRACGAVVCHRCSARTIRLEYDDSRESRICDECYITLEEHAVKTRRDSLYKARSKELCIKKGYIHTSSDKGKSWQRRWFEVHEGGNLYCYRAQQDICPISHVGGAIPKIITYADTHVIQLHIAMDKYCWLKEEDASKLQPWVEALESGS